MVEVDARVEAILREILVSLIGHGECRTFPPTAWHCFRRKLHILSQRCALQCLASAPPRNIYASCSLPSWPTTSSSIIVSSRMGFSFPSTAGIETFEPAVLFAVLYIVLVLLYIGKTARNPAYAFIALVFFCICEWLLCTADL